MFARWGRAIYRHRRLVAVLALAAALVAGVASAMVPARLSNGGWQDPASESAQVAARVPTDFGGGQSSLVALVRGPAGTVATSPAFQAALASALAGVRSDRNVTGIVGYAETGDLRFISTDGTAAYCVIGLAATDEHSVDLVPGIQARLTAPAGYSVALTGYGPLQRDGAAASEQDLVRAEGVSLPVALFILALVFGSLIAAGMPLLVAGLAIPTSLAIVALLSRVLEMSLYVQNIATMLGLALAIDYSLFIVSRFRDELQRGRSTAAAVERAVATAGKAVVFSGLAVSVGLAGLLLIPVQAIRSIGLGGAITTATSVAFALTFLPAVLGMLGNRVDALSLRRAFGGLRQRLGGQAGAPRPSRWETLAHAVMRRPVAVLLPTLALLMALGTPFLQIQQGVPDAGALPAGLVSRDAALALRTDFPAGETTPYVVLAEVPGDPTSPATAAALARYAQALASVPGVDHVEGAFAIKDPATGAAMTPDQVAAFWSAPAAALPPAQAAVREELAARYVAARTVRFDVISPYGAATPEATALVPVLRAVPAGDGFATTVGGQAAVGHDILQAMQGSTPLAIGFTLVVIALVLFLLFGSVVLPVKAVLMTLLSISASFGALVWIFQEGNLAGLLHFQSLGYTISGNPIIMFCILFGLSMDYEVLLLSRIQEAYRRTGDNTAAVADGLARTAGVITGAAAVMVTVFGAFALADTITIKSLGVGMAIAVAVDATVIRVLLVPATMRLLGRWNWWAPSPLRVVADRLGFDHVDDDERPEPPAGGSDSGSAGSAVGPAGPVAPRRLRGPALGLGQ